MLDKDEKTSNYSSKISLRKMLNDFIEDVRKIFQKTSQIFISTINNIKNYFYSLFNTEIEKEENKDDNKEENKNGYNKIEKHDYIKDKKAFFDSSSGSFNVNDKTVFTNMMNNFSSYNKPYGGIKMYFEQEVLFVYDDYNVRVW